MILPSEQYIIGYMGHTALIWNAAGVGFWKDNRRQIPCITMGIYTDKEDSPLYICNNHVRGPITSAIQEVPVFLVCLSNTVT